MTAKDYKITFPYGATSNPYTPARPHRGNDRPTSLGTKIVIGTTEIGTTGRTGKVTGPHLHTQAGSDIGCQQTFDPSRLEFKSGTVVRTRNTNTGEWGKYVTLKVGDEYITYAHLDDVFVEVGQVISEEEVMNRGDIVNFYRTHLGREPDNAAFARYIGMPWHDVWYEVTASGEFKEYQNKPNRTIATLQEQVKSLSAQLAVVGGDTELLNKFGNILVALLKRLGLRS